MKPLFVANKMPRQSPIHYPHLLGVLDRIENLTLSPMDWSKYHEIIRKLIQNNAPAISANTMDSELKNLLGQKKKILAIKYYRDQTGVSLKEAKEYVERMQGKLNVYKEVQQTLDGKKRSKKKPKFKAPKIRLRHRNKPKAKKRKQVA